MINKARPGTTHPLLFVLMLGFGLTLVVASVFFFLSPLEEYDVDAMMDVMDGGTGLEVRSSIDESEDPSGATTRNRILPDPYAIPKKSITGFLSLDGSMLGGVTIQAFADLERKIPHTSAKRIKSSPLFYSELAAELGKTIDVETLIEQPDAHRPEPVAVDTTEKDGSFRLELPPGKHLFLEIDHDFYFLPPDQEGPWFWTDKEGDSALEGFDGRLEAELGAMVHVTIEDNDDFPVEGAVVDLVRGKDRTPMGMDAGSSVLTDNEGVCTFRGIPPERPLNVQCAIEGWAPVRSDEIITQPGQVHRITMKLSEGTTIEVLVNGPEGDPLPDALVFLEAYDARDRNRDKDKKPPRITRIKDLLRSGARGIVDSGITDQEGRLQFHSQSPGEYTVRASFPGFAEAVTDPPAAVTESWSVVPVELTLGWGQIIEGVVLDDRDSPVANATIHAVPHSKPSRKRADERSREIQLGLMTTPKSLQNNAETDAAGLFSITGLDEDAPVDLIAMAEGYTLAMARDITPPSRKVVLVMDRLGAIEGRVIDAIDSNPIDSFTIRIVPAPEEEGKRWNWRGRDRRRDREPDYEDGVRTLTRALQETMDRLSYSDIRQTEREEEFANVGGEFRLQDIIPGRYCLCVSSKKYAPGLSEFFNVDIGKTRQEVSIALGPGATIRGNVYSDSGATSGADIRIRVEDREDRELGLLLDTVMDPTTDREGAFALTGLPAGEFVIRASHEDHPPVISDPVVVAEGQALEGVTLTFPPGATIKGVVIDDEGQPLERETVTCRTVSEGEGRRIFRRTRTDGSGAFEFKDLIPETYRISLTKEKRIKPITESRTDDLLLSVEEGDELEVLLKRPAPEGVTITGFVTSNGMPIRQGFLTFRQEGRKGPSRNSSIEDDGSYKVQGVTPGTIRIHLRLNSNESTSMPLEVPDKREIAHNIELPGGSIGGTVQDGATGLPLRGARITLIPMAQQGRTGNAPDRKRTNGPKKTMFSDSQGAFKFRLIAPGYYRLRADAPEGEGPGYSYSELFDIAVADNQAVDRLEVYLYKGGGLHATILNPFNEALKNVLVTAIEDNDGSRSKKKRSFRGRTGDDGTVLINGLAPGRYRLTYQAKRMAQQTQNEIYITRDRYTNVQAVLSKGFSVSVRLTMDNGTPIQNARLTLKDAKGARYAVPKTNRKKSGRNKNTYSLGYLTPGAYTLRANWKSGNATQKIQVSKSGVIPVKFKSRTPKNKKTTPKKK